MRALPIHIHLRDSFRLLSFIVLTLVSGISIAAQPTALPKSIHAVYQVTKEGQPFAKVHEQFTITQHQYKIESVTKGIGIYALFGERVLTSAGEVNAQGLKPTRFELRQGDNDKKTLLAEFDWAHQTLRMTAKGKVKEVALVEGTQDLASYAYQFMFLPMPLKDTLNVVLTTGKKLNQYPYQVSPTLETIESAGVSYKTVRLTQQEQNKPESKTLWLATEQAFIPAKILMVDENGQKLEQTLIELKLE